MSGNGLSNMIKGLRKYYQTHPFFIVGLIGLIIRIVATIYSGGYAMYDDHFVYVESSYSWFLGLDIGGWNQAASAPRNPILYNYLYPKILEQLFRIINSEPTKAMLFVRFIHALWSMVGYYFALKLSLSLFSRSIAIRLAWFIALLWLFPFLSVRNLVEWICVPFLVIGVYYVFERKNLWLAGLCFALAISFRMQTILLPIGMILVYVYYREWKFVTTLSLMIILFSLLIDGCLGYYYFHMPFGHHINNLRFNILSPASHTKGNYFMYLGTVFGVFLFMAPSIVLGFWNGLSKKTWPLFGGIAMFVFGHSIIQNKQERFMFPILLFVLVLGLGSWYTVLPVFQLKFQKFFKKVEIVFWGVNLLLLITFSTYNTKGSRVELMQYLARNLSKDSKILVDYRPSDYYIQLPTMYSNYKHDMVYLYQNDYGILGDQGFLNYYDRQYFARDISFMHLSAEIDHVDKIVVYSDEHIEERLRNLRTSFPKMRYETTIEASFLDKLIHRINPVNDEGKFLIYNP